MSHGPIYLWQLIYQAKTDVVNRGAPETVSVDRWLQPLSLPVPPKPGLHASQQPFQPYEETARFPEIVSEDRFHQPWSEPIRSRLVPAALQSTTAFTAIVAPATSIDRYLQPWSEPPKPKTGLAAHQQHVLAFNPNPAISIPWFNWLSEPVRIKLGLAASAQQVLALAEAAPFPERVSEDRWHQPWSEPIRIKPSLATGAQQYLAYDPAVFVPLPASWWAPFVEVPKVKPAVAWQQYLAFDPAVFVPSIDAWGMPLTEPVRVKPPLAAAAQQALAYTTFVTTTPTVDGWGSALSQPQRQLLGLAPHQQQALAFVSVVTTASIDGWGTALSEPQRRLDRGHLRFKSHFPVFAAATTMGWFEPLSEPPNGKPWLATHQQQALALAEAAPFPEIVSEDRFHQPWSEPVRTRSLPASEQQAIAFVPVITTQVFEDSWHQRWTDPIQFSASWKTGDNSVGFIAVQSPAPSIGGWGSPWSEPPRPKPATTAALQQFLAFAPFVTTAVPSVDGWAQPWSTPPKPKVSVNVAAQQALAFDPAVFVPSVDGWQRMLAEPVRIQPRLTSDAIFFPPNFTAVAPSFGYFGPFSEPQRQLAGLAARFNQDAANGFVPIVPPFVFFFGNEEPLPWPGFRVNQFIRENYDQLAFPPFPIPNPPQTQAKFTVSGPSVSDLFPVSGVVYPYAPETRKTVP